jgi:hypothetical protein
VALPLFPFFRWGLASTIRTQAGRAGHGTDHRMLNPLRSEAEAFRFLLYVVAVVAAIVVVVLLLRLIF